MKIDPSSAATANSRFDFLHRHAGRPSQL